MRLWVNICKTELSQSHSKYPTNISYPKYGLPKNLIFLYYTLICKKCEGMINAREPNGRTNLIMNVLGTSVTWTQNVHLFTVKSSPVSDKEPVGMSTTEPSNRSCPTHQDKMRPSLIWFVSSKPQTHKVKGEMFIKKFSVYPLSKHSVCLPAEYRDRCVYMQQSTKSTPDQGRFQELWIEKQKSYTSARQLQQSPG